MKKYKVLISICLVLLILTACDASGSESTNSDSNTSPVEVEPEATTTNALRSIDTVEPIEAGLAFSIIENTIDENYIQYSEHYGLISNLDDTKIRTQINQSIKSAISKLKNNSIQIERSLYDQTSDNPLEMSVTGNPVYFDSRILSYEIVSKSKTKEGPESLNYIFLNYDLKSGQLIKLGDITDQDTLYHAIQSLYPDLDEDAINKGNMSFHNLNQHFHFSDESNAVFLLEPYELNSNQTEFVKVPLTAIHYDGSKKSMIGSAVQSIERIEATDSYDIFFSYPHFDSSNDIYSKINQSIEENADEFYDYGTHMAILDHIATDEAVTTMEVESQDSNLVDYDDAFSLSPYWFNLSYEIYTNNEKILSFGLYDYQYTGGAHGLSTGHFYSYDLGLEKEIELKDLFEPKFDYMTYINDQIYRKIDQEIKKNPESDYAYYDFSGIDENVKFYIEENELVIFFDLYEIAAYAAGTPTFRIPLP